MDNTLQNKKTLEAILSPQEISEIQMFLERPVLMEAVKKVLLYPIMYQGVLERGKAPDPGKNFLLQLVASQYTRQGMINNQSLGEDLRAKYEGMTVVMSAFEEIKSLAKVVKDEKLVSNKAR